MLSNHGAGEDSWESLDFKEIKLVNPKRYQPWIFIRSTDTEAEAPILWPPDAKSQLTGKDPDAGKGWRKEEKGTAEDKMVRWHQQLNGHEFDQTPGENRRKQWHPTPVLLPGKSMDGGAWWAAVHGVAKIRTWLSDFTFTFHFHALEKEMTAHSSILAWRIPGMAEPGGLPSMGSHKVGHN